MKIEHLKLEGLALIINKKFGDDRGFFCERFREDAFIEAGLPIHFVQENYSRSQVEVLRGLHYQFDKPQGKLVTCTRGHITDVAVDIRKGSKTFGQHVAVELDGSDPRWFWVPAGFAHGFCVNSADGADLLYKVTEYYNPAGEAGILWEDKDLNILWPVKNPVLSDKDQRQPTFKEYSLKPKF